MNYFDTDRKQYFVSTHIIKLGGAET